MIVPSRFVTETPSSQAAIDLFDGEWSSAMPAGSGLVSRPGHADLFDDPRVRWMAEQLGPVRGAHILELGPLEGAHSHMLERMDAASVTAIEANTRAYLKCLCVKEAFGLTRVRFHLGSFLPFLRTCGRYDLIVASGVLYHMTDPLELLDLLTRRSDKIFLWTHYYDPDVIGGRVDREAFAQPSVLDDSGYRASKRLYPEAALSWSGFSGGPDSYAVWLERDSLLRFFRSRGYRAVVSFDDPGHPNGPSLALCAERNATD